MKASGTGARSLSLLEQLALLPDEEWRDVLSVVPHDEWLSVIDDWRFQARPEQLAPDQRDEDPDPDWSIWLLMAGRGFGKTRAGAEWVTGMALEHPGCRIALLGATAHDVRTVMLEGESGLLSVAPEDFRPEYRATARELRWPNGALATLFSAMEPDSLRGPQFHFAWADEIAVWAKAQAVWDNLKLGLRLGEQPRVVVTTTPRPVPLLRMLLADPDVSVSRGSSFDNRANLPARFLDDLERSYGLTALGRQEVMGELVEDVPGALWSRDLIERCRGPEPATVTRVVVGVDPPAGPGGCGIVVAALGADGRGHVLADASVAGVKPDQWAAAVAAAATRFQADRVVAETNNGGFMVEEVLRIGHRTLPLKLVHASRGKSARAEPVSALFAAGQVVLCGAFPALEDEMCGLIAGGGYVGPGDSPDRADAMVWALTELMLGDGSRPRLRALG